MRIEKVLKYQNIIVMVIVVLFVGFTFFFGQYESTKFSDSYEVYPLESFSVYYADSGEPSQGSFPIKIDAIRGETTRIETVIPSDIKNGYGIMLYTNYSQVAVYADGVLIGSYCQKMPLPFGRLIGNIRCLYQIDEIFAGKILTIEYKPLYTSKLNYNTIYTGDIHALKLEVLYQNIWKLIFSMILYTFCVICIGISLFHLVKRMPTNNWAFYHLGCFLFYIATWLICSSDLPQFVTDANETISIISFISLAVMPIHYAAFSTEILEGTRKWFSIIQLVGWFYPIIMIIGMVFGLYEPPDILIANHIIIGITCIFVVFFTILKSKEDETARRFGRANIVLVITAIFAIIMFYIFAATGWDAFVMGVGMSVYAGYLFFTILTVEFEYIKQLQKNDIYKQLAYTDIMTDLGNRAAFNERLSQIDADKNSKDRITLLILDINRLKVINDTQGHEMGDRLIVGAAQCISKAFGSVGECFRIGGDEFAVIIVNATDGLEECVSKLDEQIGAFNFHNDNLGLSISIGAALGANPGADFTRELFKQADENMYADKKEWHRILDARA